MPLGVVVWVDDRPDQVDIYIDADLIKEVGARVLQLALAANTGQGHWRREIQQLVAAI
jgi:hypothetical protein